MKRLFLLALAFALISILVGRPASAYGYDHEVYTPDQGMIRSMQIAEAYWPGVCHPEIWTVTEETADSLGKGGHVGWAPLGGNPCVIILEPNYFTGDPTFQCMAIVHEYGHLAGYDHSPDPNSIMNGDAYPAVFLPCSQTVGLVQINLHTNRKPRHRH